MLSESEIIEISSVKDVIQALGTHAGKLKMIAHQVKISSNYAKEMANLLKSYKELASVL